MKHLYTLLLTILLTATVAVPAPLPVHGGGGAYTRLDAPMLLPGAPSSLYMTIGNASYLIGLNVIVKRGEGFYVTGNPVRDAAATPDGLVALLSNGTLIRLDQGMRLLWSTDTGYTEIMEPRLRVTSGYVVVYRSPMDYADYMEIYRLDTGALAATITRQGAPSHGYTIAVGPSYIVELLATSDGGLSLAIYSVNGTLLYTYINDGASLPEYPVAAASLRGAAIVFTTVPAASKMRVLLYNGAENWFTVDIPGSYHGWGAAVVEGAADGYHALVAVPGASDTYAASLILGPGGAVIEDEYYAPLPATRYYTAGGWIAYLSDQSHVVAINNGGTHIYVLDESFTEPLFDVDIWCINDTWLLAANHDEKTVLIDTFGGEATTIARGTRLHIDGYYATVTGRGVYRVTPRGLVEIDELAAAKGYAADPFTPGTYYRVVMKLNGSLALQRISIEGTVTGEIVLGETGVSGYAYIYRSLMGGYIYVIIPSTDGTELYRVDPGMNSVIDRAFLGASAGPYAFYEDNGHIAVVDTGYSEVVYQGTLYSDRFYTGLDPGKHHSYVVHGGELIVVGSDGGVHGIDDHVVYAHWVARGVLAYIAEAYGEPRLVVYSYSDGAIYSVSAEDAKPIIGDGYAAIVFYANHTLRVIRFTGDTVTGETYSGVRDAAAWGDTLYVSWLNGSVSRLGSPGTGEYKEAVWMPGPPVLRVAGVFLGLSYSGAEEHDVPTLLPYVESLRLDIVPNATTTAYIATLHIRVVNMSSGEPAANVYVNTTTWSSTGWSSVVQPTDPGGRAWLRIPSEYHTVLLETRGGVPVMYPLRPVSLVFTEEGSGEGYCLVDGYNYTHASAVYGVSYRVRYGVGAERNRASDPGPLYTGVDGGVYGNATGWAAALSRGEVVNNTMSLLSSGGSTAYLYARLKTAWRETVELRGNVTVGGTEEYVARVEAWYSYTYSGFYGLGYTTTIYGRVVAEARHTYANTYVISPNESAAPRLGIVEIHTRGETFYAILLDNIVNGLEDMEVAAVRINGTDYTEQVASAITGETDKPLLGANPVIPGNYTIDSSVTLYRVGLLVSMDKAGVPLRGRVEIVIRGRGGSLNYTIALSTQSPITVYYGGEEYPSIILENLLSSTATTMPAHTSNETTNETTGGATSGATGEEGHTEEEEVGNVTGEEGGTASTGGNQTTTAGGGNRGLEGQLLLAIITFIIILAGAVFYLLRRRK